MSTIIKSKLTNGVFWLDFPGADLRILCGCPADAVKHMMKRGVILANDASPVFHESGPNAILLSDLTVQKGSFSNLGEFPVLQMLYRQGMILPNHPGNTGVKPLLLGHADQVAAQIEYIYRGNYGLVSEEEIRAAGASAKTAKEAMRLKLKFAFGKIVDPHELLDSQIVENTPREIRNGVYVRRVSVNVFEFEYNGSSTTVDLNLKSNEQYLPSYKLGHYTVGREYFSVIHSGEGDGWDIERPTMASIITFQGKVYLIDVGPNIETSLHSLGIDISEIEGIFLTHCHDDHFAGLPSLIRSDHRIKFFATPLVRAATVKKLSALISQDESRFSRFFDVQDIVAGQWNDIEGLEVRPEVSPHPMETTILFFRTQWDSDYKTYAHLADIAAFDVLKGMITDDPNEPGISAKYFEEVRKLYLRQSDVKKIDNGGGLIHGMAKDFASDKSDKIIFAHTARPLNDEERQIGSGAPFGTEDILIPSNHDMLFGRAYAFLKTFFPDLPQDQFRLLLNHEVVKFNPEEIILRDGENIDYTYFILTGSAEMLDVKTNRIHRVSGGSFIGDLNGLYDIKSTETYRAVSFVRALKLPIDMYKKFVKRNGTFETLSQLAEKRELLQKSWLFGGSISDGIKNTIAASMQISNDISLCRSADFVRDYVGLVKEGSVTLKLGTRVFQELGPGDTMFEDHAVYGMNSIFDIEFSDNCAVALIPTSVISEIPIVQWKLLETVALQMRSLADANEWDDTLLQWRDEYGVGQEEIDQNHKTLLEMTKEAISVIKTTGSAEQLEPHLAKLLAFTRYHIEREAELAAETPSLLKNNLDNREKVVGQLETIKAKCTKGAASHDIVPLEYALKRWILIHVLLGERKFASYIARAQN